MKSMSNSNHFQFEIQVLDHKYKSLFRDIDINYVMTEIKMKSIFKLISLNYTNFFIMGSLETIEYVLGRERFLKIDKYLSSAQILSFCNDFTFSLQKTYRAIDLPVVINGLDSHKNSEIYHVAVEASI